MKIFLTLVVVLFLVGCTKSNISPQPAAKPCPPVECAKSETEPQSGSNPSNEFVYSVYASEQSLWLKACTSELAHGLPEFTVFVPKAHPAEEIFQECIRIKPLPADKVPTYEKWLTERICEIQSITVGITRKKVEDILMISGGFSMGIEDIYLHPKCNVLKVRIEFEPDSDAHGRTMIRENDKVTSVSMPYLGFSPMD